MFIDENDIRTPRDRGEEELRRLFDASPAGVTVPCDCHEGKEMRGEKAPSCPFSENMGRDCTGRLSERQIDYSLRGFPLAMVYSPIQEWRHVYDEKKALSRGTLFAELDKPLEGGKCHR